MTRTKFKDGIVAGVPTNVVVAHKFGIWRMQQPIQLHDCGIVYYPRKPYLLCVMTKGNNPDQMASVIRDISRRIYEGMEAETKPRVNVAGLPH